MNHCSFKPNKEGKVCGFFIQSFPGALTRSTRLKRTSELMGYPMRARYFINYKTDNKQQFKKIK